MAVRRFTQLVLTTCALAALLAGAGAMPFEGVFLCIGSDGHRELEFSADGCCRTPAPAGEKAQAGVGPVQDSCGDCVDLPLGTPVLYSSSTRLGSPSFGTLAWTRPQPLGAGGDLRTRQVPGHPVSQQASGSLAALTTVVLLT